MNHPQDELKGGSVFIHQRSNLSAVFTVGNRTSLKKVLLLTRPASSILPVHFVWKPGVLFISEHAAGSYLSNQLCALLRAYNVHFGE